MDKESEQEVPAPPAERGGGEPELGTSVRRTSSIIERLAAGIAMQAPDVDPFVESGVD